MDYKVFHSLSYGLYVVASEWEGQQAGFIANSVFQVTSSPPQIVLSCNKNNHTAGIIIKSGIFSVSVLKKEVSTALIGEFGFMTSSEVDKFGNVKIEKHATGAPVLIDSSIAWLDCRVKQMTDVGTHILFVAEVVDGKVISEDEPLTYEYYRKKYKMLSPRNAPTYIEPEKLLPEEKTGKVVLNETPAQHNDYDLNDDDEKYICTICGYVYDPEIGDPSMGILPGTPFADLPEDYRCPICNAGSDYFKPVM